MNQTSTKQAESLTVSARLSKELNRQVEAEVARGGFINKSRFVEAAIRAYIEMRQGQRTNLRASSG